MSAKVDASSVLGMSPSAQHWDTKQTQEQVKLLLSHRPLGTNEETPLKRLCHLVVKHVLTKCICMDACTNLWRFKSSTLCRHVKVTPGTEGDLACSQSKV